MSILSKLLEGEDDYLAETSPFQYGTKMSDLEVQDFVASLEELKHGEIRWITSRKMLGYTFHYKDWEHIGLEIDFTVVRNRRGECFRLITDGPDKHKWLSTRTGSKCYWFLLLRVEGPLTVIE